MLYFVDICFTFVEVMKKMEHKFLNMDIDTIYSYVFSVVSGIGMLVRGE